MREFIPDIIVKNIDKEYGEIEGFCFQVDLSGFTQIVDNYSKIGKEGLETLSDGISFYIDMLFNSVYEHEGFISNISGDSFTSIFEGKNILNPLCAINKIRKILYDLTQSEIYCKMTLSYGNIEWGIIKNTRNVFYFRGKPMYEVFEMQKVCQPGEFIASDICEKYIKKLVEEEEFTYEGNRYYRILSIINTEYIESFYSSVSFKDISNVFYPEIGMKNRIFSEFREVVSIFIGLKKNIEYSELKKTISFILEKMEKYGGYFNSLDFSDKGGYALINFGAPVCWENNLERSCDFVLELIADKNYEFRIGMNYGVSYCGVLGNSRRKYYSCIGPVTNIAAKIMVKTSENSVLITEKMNEIIKYTYKTDFFTEILFKGIYGKNKIYKLIKKNPNPVFRYAGIYTGRINEIETGRKCINKVFEEKKNGILYIFGEKGIGKSRYTNEILSHDDYLSAIKIYLKGEFLPDIALSPIKKYFNSIFNRKNTGFDIMLKNYLKSYGMLSIPDEIKNNFNIYINIYKYLAGIEVRDTYYNKNKKVVFEGFAAYLQMLSCIGKVIVIIDDLHLFDKVSVSCLNYAIGKVKNNSIMYLINSRYFKNEKIITPIKNNQSDLNIIELKPLKKSETKSYLRKTFLRDIGEDFFEMIYHKTEGNPYYLEEYTRYLKDNNYLDYSDKIEIRNDVAAEIPFSIGTLIINKYDKLDEEFKKLIRYASAFGETFSRKILYQCVESKDFYRFLESGEELGFWYKVNNKTYKFRHAIICEIIYNMQFKSTNREIHKNIADNLIKLNERGNPLYYNIGYHYEIAGERIKAIEYYEKAYKYYFDNFMNDEAIEMLGKIKKMTRDKDVEIDCYLREIMIYERNGEYIRLLNTFESYLESYENTMNLKNRAYVYYYGGMNYFDLKNYALAKKYLYEAIELSKNIKDEKLYGKLLGKIGLVKLAESEYNEAEKLIKEELYTGLKYEDKDIICSSLNSLSLYYVYTGKLEYVERYLKIVNNIAKEAKNKKYVYKSVSNLGYVYVSTEEYEKALKCYLDYLAIAMEIGNKMNILTAYGNIGYLYMRMGKFEEFELYNKKKNEMLKEFKIDFDLYMMYLNYGEMYILKEEYEKAVEYLLKVYKYFTETKRELEMGFCTFLTAAAYYGAKDYQNALDFINISISKYERTDYKNNKYECSLLKMKILYMMNKDFDIVKKLREKIDTADLDNLKAETLYEIWYFERTKENAGIAVEKLTGAYEKGKKYKLLKMKEEIENYI